MKQQKFPKPMDEREKLRRFRELDNAFAEALRELDGGAADAANSPSVGADAVDVPDEALAEADTRDRQQDFERRLEALMLDYALPAESVSDLLQTLRALGRIA